MTKSGTLVCMALGLALVLYAVFWDRSGDPVLTMAGLGLLGFPYYMAATNPTPEIEPTHLNELDRAWVDHHMTLCEEKT